MPFRIAEGKLLEWGDGPEREVNLKAVIVLTARERTALSYGLDYYEEMGESDRDPDEEDFADEDNSGLDYIGIEKLRHKLSRAVPVSTE